jgi:hypothetical protein
MKPSRLALLLCALVPAGLAFGSPGCSNQGEGERCSTFNANDDCQNGLICLSKEITQQPSDLCCPPKPLPPNVPECIPGSGTPAPEAGTPDSAQPDVAQPDTATAETGTDATADQSTADAPAEQGADAPAEAPSEAGDEDTGTSPDAPAADAADEG